MTKLGDFVGEGISTLPAAQDHFMAPGQRLSRECERDSAGADRPKFHAPLLSFVQITCPGSCRKRSEVSLIVAPLEDMDFGDGHGLSPLLADRRLLGQGPPCVFRRSLVDTRLKVNVATYYY